MKFKKMKDLFIFDYGSQYFEFLYVPFTSLNFFSILASFEKTVSPIYGMLVDVPALYQFCMPNVFFAVFIYVHFLLALLIFSIILHAELSL